MGHKMPTTFMRTFEQLNGALLTLASNFYSKLLIPLIRGKMKKSQEKMDYPILYINSTLRSSGGQCVETF